MGASSIHPSHRNRVADIGDLSIDALGSEEGLQLRGIPRRIPSTLLARADEVIE
jgi:hypothetical protein